VIETLAPRNFRPVASLVETDIATHLRDHQDAFDCLLYRAIPGSEETVAIVPDVVGSLEGGDRHMEHAPPVPCRAMIIPDEAAAFGIVDEGLMESFEDPAQPLVILVSGSVPRHSILVWREYVSPESEARAERIV
jgi:hypothetical protein